MNWLFNKLKPQIRKLVDDILLGYNIIQPKHQPYALLRRGETYTDLVKVEQNLKQEIEQSLIEHKVLNKAPWQTIFIHNKTNNNITNLKSDIHDTEIVLLDMNAELRNLRAELRATQRLLGVKHDTRSPIAEAKLLVKGKKEEEL